MDIATRPWSWSPIATVCGPRRSATCNGSRSNCPRAAFTFTVSRTGFLAYIPSAVTRCGRCASYAAITRLTPTYSFPSPAPRGGRQDAIPDPPAHASPCLWVQAGQRWPRHAGAAALPRVQEHSAHRQVHRNGARPVQGLLEGLTIAGQMTRVRAHLLGPSLAPRSDRPS